ncbi:S8 family peptidase [Planococcus beigongshangi]|uniref:S8 family peptidase n=1 Tax=Planococcus beigongshangi TaxID=2782536 RepID=UPI00193B1B18|nr:S8 family serine peptidase [Planococcus beigongshangi]
MRRIFGLLLFIVIGMGLHTTVMAEEPEMHRVIVIFEEGGEQQAIEELDGIVTETYDYINAASIIASEESIMRLKESDFVAHVEEDILVQGNIQQIGWAIPQIGTPLSWNTGYTGKNVKIGVIDSGIAEHPDLKVAGGVSIVGYTNSYIDDSGHGTHIAGIIGALDNSIGIKGVASGASLYAIKVFDANNKAYLADVIKGIEWAIANDMDIINLSLGVTKDSEAFRQIIRKAHAQDMILVAAAGNGGFANPAGDLVEYPARYDEVIAVSAVDESLNRAHFSAAGPAVEIAAPGVAINSTYLNKNYMTMSGTSMATPYIVGQAALIKEAYPSLTNEQVRSVLPDNALDLGAKGWDPIFGVGMIQAAAYDMPAFGKTATKNPAETLHIEKTSIVGIEGLAKTAKAIIGLKNGKNVDMSEYVAWKSTDESIAKVEKGRITFLAEGNTKITASYGNLTAEMQVSVEKGPTVLAAPFKDVTEEHWAYDEIREMSSKGVITGYTATGKFEPFHRIRREHVAVMLDRAFPLPVIQAYSPFPDISENYHYFDAIKAVQQAGIFSGNETGFAPKEELTRAQMAKILVLAFDLKADGEHPFPDVAKSHWANDYISILYHTGVTTGSYGEFKLDEKVTRAHFAVFMSRAFEWQENQKNIQ